MFSPVKPADFHNIITLKPSVMLDKLQPGLSRSNFDALFKPFLPTESCVLPTLRTTPRRDFNFLSCS